MNVVIIGFSPDMVRDSPDIVRDSPDIVRDSPDMVRDSKFCKSLSTYSIPGFEGCQFRYKKALLILYNIIKYYISEWGKI